MNKYKQAWFMVRAYTEGATEHGEDYPSQDWLDSLDTVEKLYNLKVTRRDIAEVTWEIKEED
jgi:hypothetical protein